MRRFSALASLTDWLDGYLARRRKQVTALGQIIDPIADKLLTSAAFVSLIQMGLAPAWMVAVIIGRELAVTTLRGIAYARGVVIPASPLGKIKMAAQVVAILALILGEEESLQPLAMLGYAALWVVVAAALISALDYYRRFTLIPVKVAPFPASKSGARKRQIEQWLQPFGSRLDLLLQQLNPLLRLLEELAFLELLHEPLVVRQSFSLPVGLFEGFR